MGLSCCTEKPLDQSFSTQVDVDSDVKEGAITSSKLKAESPTNEKPIKKKKRTSSDKKPEEQITRQESVNESTSVYKRMESEKNGLVTVEQSVYRSNLKEEPSEEQKPASPPTSQYLLDQSEQKDPSSDRSKVDTTNRSTPYSDNGAYLYYSEANNGSLYSIYKKVFDPEAIAACRPAPGIRVPMFKYRNQVELIKNLNVSTNKICEAFIHFFKALKVFKCTGQYLGIKDHNIPEIDIYILNNKYKVIRVKESEFFETSNMFVFAVVERESFIANELNKLLNSKIAVTVSELTDLLDSNKKQAAYLIL